MLITQSKIYQDLDISFSFGNYEIRVIHIGYIVFHPDEPIPKHEHHCFEFHYIPSGNGTVIIDGQNFLLHSNDCYVVGPHVEHAQFSAENSPMIEYGLNFEIIPKRKTVYDCDTLQYREETVLITDFLKNQLWMGSGNSHFSSLFEAIKDEFDNQYIGYYSNIKHLLYSIMILILRSYIETPKADYHIPRKNLNIKRQELIHTYLNTNYQNGSKEELSNLLGISSRQLTREISLLYPESSFKKELLSIRLRHAKMMLEYTRETIESIASKTGFSSPGYFSNVFKLKYKMTPSEYRDTYLKSNSSLAYDIRK